tara:strand:+ start:8663 stop:8962 length:300 start_codon:yes stop_codon:yes gene_type:complete
MFIQGNLNYTYSGRKKTTHKVKKVKKAFVPLNTKKHLQFHPSWWDSQRKAESKKDFLPWTDPECQLYRKEISSKYTVSIPYNKGTYQVISNEDVKHIGK